MLIFRIIIFYPAILTETEARDQFLGKIKLIFHSDRHSLAATEFIKLQLVRLWRRLKWI
jgi:hypothetical protein